MHGQVRGWLCLRGAHNFISLGAPKGHNPALRVGHGADQATSAALLRVIWRFKAEHIETEFATSTRCLAVFCMCSVTDTLWRQNLYRNRVYVS